MRLRHARHAKYRFTRGPSSVAPSKVRFIVGDILPSILPSEVHVESTKLTFPGVVVDCTGGSRVPSDPHSITIVSVYDSLSAEAFASQANALFLEANRIEVPLRPRFAVRFRKPKDFSIPLHPMKAVADSRPKNEVK